MSAKMGTFKKYAVLPSKQHETNVKSLVISDSYVILIKIYRRHLEGHRHSQYIVACAGPIILTLVCLFPASFRTSKFPVTMTTIITENQTELIRKLANLIEEASNKAIEENGVFKVGVSGKVCLFWVVE